MTNIFYQIHGDNIVECTRTFDYVLLATADTTRNVVGPYGSITCPSYDIHLNSGDTLSFNFLPGFGEKRWNQDILAFVKNAGGRLREAADAIVTVVTNGVEKPLFAMEFCGALPAGNNAWQRHGRAFSFAHAGIPYFYLAELGGYELTSTRELKAERWPNPAVPFSFFSMTHYHGSVCLPVYEANSGARAETTTLYDQIFGKSDFVEYIRLVFNGEATALPARRLSEKCADLVERLAGSKKRQDGLSAGQWREARKAVEEGLALTTYLSADAPIVWRKTAYIADLTPSARDFMKLGAEYSLGLTSATLPLSFVTSSNRQSFADGVRNIYGDIDETVAQWLGRGKSDLAIAWIMGFKPRGDDARPDRGLPPLARMLIGENTDLLAFVYGPAPSYQWGLLQTSPGKLARSNGLWEAVMGVSDALLLDGATMPKEATRAFLKQSWASSFPQKTEVLHVKPVVLTPSEQDVDTALHVLFAALGSDVVFEGMCNPPGGDWSGVSFVWSKEGGEHRWLTLPRVTPIDSKRPDHVFAFFGLGDLTICLCVESKERPRSLESAIGPRLISYTKTLFGTAPSIWRQSKTESWAAFTEEWLLQDAAFVSMGAYIANPRDPFGNVSADTQLDILCGFTFSDNASECVVYVRSLTELGKQVLDYIISATQSPSVQYRRG